ncbi:esterase/lipase family protein [Nocardia sp. NPDC056000]|uniref:esterase/lipase family protein n=1 Tax=Nocardia sp. NPDC056000 TaxID=3345674 RepID=UPI0035D7B3F5
MRIAAKFMTALVSAGTVAIMAAGPVAAAPDTGSGSAVVPAGTTIEPPIDCTPDSAHPRPVVVLPGGDGTTAETTTQWNTLLSTVRAAGHCAFLFQGGVINGSRWTGDIPSAAQQVADFVTKVRQTTGADQVDIIAHSAGTIVANYFLKVLDGAPVVAHAVFLTPDKANLVQMLPSSPVYQAVFNGPITQPGVRYSVLSTRNDELATPATVCTNLTEPGVNMNFYEDLFPGTTPVGHSSLRSSSDTANWVAQQLQP